LQLANPYSLAVGWRGFCSAYMGETERAKHDFERAIEIAREHGDAEAECYLHAARGFVGAGFGDEAAARADAALALELGVHAGNAMGIATASLAYAAVDAATGRFAEARARAEKAVASARERRPGLHFESALLAALARARLGLADPEGALAAAEDAVEIMDARGLRAGALSAPLALAHVLRATGGAAERIESVLTRALDVARECGAVIYERQLEEQLAALRDAAGA
jgi:tetratricopeptide (TPR) repeat protein